MSDILKEVASNTAHAIGFAFLSGLVKSMRSAMDASTAFVTIGHGKPPVRVRSISSWCDGAEEENFEYDLEGTPCKLVYDGEIVIVSEGLYQRFPREAGFEGYVGVPLRHGDGSSIGHLGVLSKDPIKNPSEAMAVTQIFGMRAEAELQRMQHQKEMESMVASLSLATRRLTDQQNALRKSNLAKTALLGTMAHDLRNPLAAILSRSEIIDDLQDKSDCDDELKQRIRKSCESIGAMVERMDRQIAACLGQAKEDATKLNVDLREFPIAQAINLAVTLNSSAAVSKAIVVETNIREDILVKGDEDRLVEAFDNLISNAIKYSNVGQSVFVKARKRTNCTEISVKDEGLGLTSADQSRAFGQFQRLSAKPTAGESSTGLGLAIVKAITDAHGGTVRVKSKGENMGAVFTITLPDI